MKNIKLILKQTFCKHEYQEMKKLILVNICVFQGKKSILFVKNVEK